MTLLATRSSDSSQGERIKRGVEFGLHEIGTTLITNDLLASFRKMSVSDAPIIQGTSFSAVMPPLGMTFPVFRPISLLPLSLQSRAAHRDQLSPACLSARAKNL